MTWNLTVEARRLISAKGRPVTVQEPVTTKSCCLTVTEAPVLNFGPPRNPEAFRLLPFEDVTIYVPLTIEAVECELTIGVRSFLGFRSLVVEGWRLA